ncbi:MAG: RnfABCDGE type electron transport complex subunit B, partial [Candidatus Omnitrophica bacterium]|nr:RnfABCDGE type electron transport complex subunit B [Candidatus Omnitrophota bacterium]
FMEIIIPILTLGFLGLLFGIGLVLASKKLAVQVDTRLEKINALLPGANCGACGKAGCFGFAQAILSGEAKIDTCRVSSDQIKEEIAKVLGRKLTREVKKIAVLHCAGGSKLKDKYIYDGIKECVAANLVLGGQKECFFGCLGFGDCQRVCPFGAIKMSKEDLPVVDENKCRGCNKCVETCPKKLFSLVPVAGLAFACKVRVYIACASHDLGKDTKAVCPVGCIGCGLCVKACKFEAIHIIDNLAVIDYNKCTSCSECVKVCPVKCIKTLPLLEDRAQTERRLK